MSINLNKLKEEYELTDEDINLLQQSASSNTAAGIQARVAAQLIAAKQNQNATAGLARKLEKSVDDVIKSNTQVAMSNDGHSWWMRWLTVVIAAAAILDVVLRILRI